MHPIQQHILELVRGSDLPPMSLRAIGKLIGEKSAQKVKHHLEQLEKKGLVVYDRNRKVVRQRTHGLGLLAVPIVGAADAGPATHFAEDSLEGFLRISPRLVPKKKGLFAIRVVGNSMNRARLNGQNIESGDYVIVDPEANAPQDGDYVLSVIEEVANIKRYYFDKKNNQVVLLSESTQNFPPIIIDTQEISNYLVNGKVVQVIKSPKA